MITAGSLTSVITLQHATEAPNASGTLVKTWTTRAVFRAAVTEEIATDTDKPDATIGRRTITLRCRERDDIHLASRVLYQGRPYEVVEIRQPARRVTEIHATAKDAA